MLRSLLPVIHAQHFIVRLLSFYLNSETVALFLRVRMVREGRLSGCAATRFHVLNADH